MSQSHSPSRTMSVSMPPPRRKEPTQYRKPNRFNAVSLALLVMMALCCYVIYCLWPVVTLRLRVKGDLEDVMNTYWRANLTGGATLREAVAKLRKDLTAKLASDGVHDKKLELVFGGNNKQRISIEARFTATAFFPGINKSYVFDLAPRAETDAARVDW
jgi:hypothetical protein